MNYFKQIIYFNGVIQESPADTRVSLRVTTMRAWMPL